VLVRRHARRQREARQRRAQVLEAERAPLGDRERGAEPRVVLPPAPPHLRRALEVPLAARPQAGAHLVERALVPQRREHVVHDAPARGGVVHVVGHHPRHAERARDREQLAHDVALLGEAVVPHLDGEAAAEDVVQRARRAPRAGEVARGDARGDGPARAAREAEDAARVARERVEVDAGVPALASHARPRDERRDVAVALARLGEEEEMGAVGFGVRGSGFRICRNPEPGTRNPDVDRQLHPHDPADRVLLGGLGEADDATEVVVVGEGERGVAERGGARDERLGGGGAIHQREHGMAVQLDVVRGARVRARVHASAHARATTSRSDTIVLHGRIGSAPVRGPPLV
jgi:hypothetical protein